MVCSILFYLSSLELLCYNCCPFLSHKLFHYKPSSSFYYINLNLVVISTVFHFYLTNVSKKLIFKDKRSNILIQQSQLITKLNTLNHTNLFCQCYSLFFSFLIFFLPLYIVYLLNNIVFM